MNTPHLKLMVILPFLALMACGGNIKTDKDSDEDVDAPEIEDPVPDVVPDQPDVQPDESEDPAMDPTEDPMPDSEPDTVPDAEPDPIDDPVEEDVSPEVPEGCTLPAIPDTGLHIYYCSLMDTTMTMRMYREVDLAAGGTIPYGEELSCRIATPAREMLCELSGASAWGTGSLVKFIIQTPGVNGGWSCPETNGVPVVKYNGSWVSLNSPITSPACRHNFDLP